MRQKTEYLNLRILPAVKEALRVLAAKEYRSIASMVEMMVRERCEKAGFPIEPKPAPPKRTPRKSAGGAKA
jgi:hypothetical protein